MCVYVYIYIYYHNDTTNHDNNDSNNHIDIDIDNYYGTNDNNDVSNRSASRTWTSSAGRWRRSGS